MTLFAPIVAVLLLPGIARAVPVNVDITVELTEALSSPALDAGPDRLLISNDSDAGVTIDAVALSFSTALAGTGPIFFDSAPGGAGSSNAFPLVAGAGAADVGFTGSLPAGPAALDGQNFLFLLFNDFDSGESIELSFDLDDSDAFVAAFNTLGTTVVVDLGGILDGTAPLFGFLDDPPISDLNVSTARTRFVATVPAPAPAALLALGLAGIALGARLRRARASRSATR